jgi:histidinol-phosphatase (PHP family)
MYARAKELGLAVLGFSEHSPRPKAYSYPKEYREHLSATFSQYIKSVLALKELEGPPLVLLGLEMDYFPSEEDYLREMVTAYSYDYIIGSVHYLDTWGFDFTPDDWNSLPEEDIYSHYAKYFEIFKDMACTGLAHIAAHPDIIKVFSVDYFNNWLQDEKARALVREALLAVKKGSMALEISSAGLRKPCREIYPGPVLMEMAAELDIPVTISSDAHSAVDLMYGFDELIAYAQDYGYTSSVYMTGGQMHVLPF